MTYKLRFVLILALLAQFTSPVAMAQGEKASPESAQSPTALSLPVEAPNPATPVEIDGRPTVYVYASVGGISKEARAEAIQARILRLANTRSVPVESIQVQERDAWSEIGYPGYILMTVTDADAEAAQRVRQRLALEDAEIIRRTVQRYREEHRWTRLLEGLLYTALVTVILLLILRGVWKVRQIVGIGFEKWVRAHQGPAKGASRLPISVTNYLWGPLRALGHGFFWFFVIALGQAYVTAVLSFFPQTHEASRATTSWLSSQLLGLGGALVDYLPNLLLVLIIAGATYTLLQLNTHIFRDIEVGKLKVHGFYADWARPTANLVRILVLALAAIVMFPYLPGAKSPAFQGVTIFLGVLLSLGSSSAVANAVAGTILNYTRSFQVGDMVSIGDTFGQVLEKSILVTRVRSTPRTDVITIPNGVVMGTAVRNYSAEAKTTGATLHTTVTIGYDAPWRRVHDLLITAALSTPHIREDPAPFVLQTALNDFYVSYELSAYTDAPDRMPSVYSELHQNIQDKFNEGGIEINSPHYTAVRDGNTVTIPAGYRPESYQSPAFRIAQTAMEAMRNHGCTKASAAPSGEHHPENHDE